MKKESQAKNFKKSKLGTHDKTLSNRYKVPAINSGIMTTKLAFNVGILYSSGGDRNSLQCGQFMLNKYMIGI